jgi:hypothetical protein
MPTKSTCIRLDSLGASVSFAILGFEFDCATASNSIVLRNGRCSAVQAEARSARVPGKVVVLQVSCVNMARKSW